MKHNIFLNKLFSLLKIKPTVYFSYDIVCQGEKFNALIQESKKNGTDFIVKMYTHVRQS
jgi:hypothetical protein